MAQEQNVFQGKTEDRAGGLKLIGAGFGRTGTRSLKEALEMLGLNPCYHMVEVFEHPEHIAHWVAASKGEAVDWDVVFQDYQATVDWPGCSFYQELMAKYPEAKVLLTVRDPEKWYESANDTIYNMNRRRHSPIASLMLMLLKLTRPGMAFGVRMVGQIVWDGTFHGRFEEKEYAISVFNQHNEEVKRYVPPEKLLVYNVKEGWEPLCAFLNVPVPDVPFPHLNDRANFPGNRARQEMQKRVINVALIAGTGALVLIFLRRLMKRGMR